MLWHWPPRKTLVSLRKLRSHKEISQPFSGLPISSQRISPKALVNSLLLGHANHYTTTSRHGKVMNYWCCVGSTGVHYRTVPSVVIRAAVITFVVRWPSPLCVCYCRCWCNISWHGNNALLLFSVERRRWKLRYDNISFHFGFSFCLFDQTENQIMYSVFM